MISSLLIMSYGFRFLWLLTASNQIILAKLRVWHLYFVTSCADLTHLWKASCLPRMPERPSVSPPAYVTLHVSIGPLTRFCPLHIYIHGWMTLLHWLLLLSIYTMMRRNEGYENTALSKILNITLAIKTKQYIWHSEEMVWI